MIIFCVILARIKSTRLYFKFSPNQGNLEDYKHKNIKYMKKVNTRHSRKQKYVRGADPLGYREANLRYLFYCGQKDLSIVSEHIDTGVVGVRSDSGCIFVEFVLHC